MIPSADRIQTLPIRSTIIVGGHRNVNRSVSVCDYGVVVSKRKHEDTNVSLHPLAFEEAIAALAHAPKHTDSQAEGSGSTTERAPASAPSKKRTAPRGERASG